MCAIPGDHSIIAAIPRREQMMRVDKLLQSHAFINMGQVQAKDLTWKDLFCVSSHSETLHLTSLT
jgi:hypothetical protein